MAHRDEPELKDVPGCVQVWAGSCSATRPHSQSESHLHVSACLRVVHCGHSNATPTEQCSAPDEASACGAAMLWPMRRSFHFLPVPCTVDNLFVSTVVMHEHVNRHSTNMSAGCAAAVSVSVQRALEHCRGQVDNLTTSHCMLISHHLDDCVAHMLQVLLRRQHQPKV